jgi:Amt family ammonium transporter
MLGWLLVERIKSSHPTTLGAASGAVAGLVAITPCAGFVGSMPAILIGFAAGVICYLALFIKKAMRLDDSLDVIAVHLVGGLVGSVLLGLFADPAINPVVTSPGLFADGGGTALLFDQIVASVVTIVYSFIVSLVIAKILDAVVGLRLPEGDEDAGMDLSLHAETAYAGVTGGSTIS